MARKVHGGRALLNLPGHHSTAAIVAEVENTADWPEGLAKGRRELDGYNYLPEVTCVIRDCDNGVSIECDLGSDNKLENSLYKVDQIIACLRKFRKGLIIENERAMQRSGWIAADKRWNMDSD